MEHFLHLVVMMELSNYGLRMCLFFFDWYKNYLFYLAKENHKVFRRILCVSDRLIFRMTESFCLVPQMISQLRFKT